MHETTVAVFGLAFDLWFTAPVGSGSVEDGGRELPSGALAFLFSDIESSTPRWEANPRRMRESLALHDEIVAGVISGFGGIVFNHTGDGVTSVFNDATSAASAALEVQRALQTAQWPDEDRLKVRIGLHDGVAQPTGRQYYGIPLNRTARVMDAANGDQIALSGSMAEKLPDFSVRSCGAHRLRGVGSVELFLLHDPSLVADARSLRSATASATRPLPEPGSRLLGRDDEILSVADLLRGGRLVTLVGPGGVGKTRLSIEAAREATHETDVKPAFCQLAPVSDADAVLEVVAQAVGARRQPELSLMQSIASFLDGRPLLLVLDNCEHVIDHVRALCEQLLDIPSVTVLASSRQAIGLAAVEQRWPVEPLPLQTGVELFVARARQRNPQFELTTEIEPLVGQICERLDGLPAAIELAAARAHVLSPEQLLDGLQNLFSVLRPVGSDTTRPLVDAIRWSHDRLEGLESSLFDQLSVFPGSFSLEAAAGIVDLDGDNGSVDVIEMLLSLVEKSMLLPTRGQRQVRFTMLQTFRAFGLEALATTNDVAATRLRHARWYAQFAEHEAQLFLTSKEPEVWTQLAAEWDNLRGAFDVLMEEDVDAAVGLVLSLSWFATFSMRFELFTWARRLRDDDRTLEHPQRAAILGSCALGAYFVADPNAEALALEAIALDPAESTGLARGALAAIYLNNLHSGSDADTVTSEWLSTVDDASSVENRIWAMALRVFHLSLSQRPGGGANPSARLANTTRDLGVATGSASAMALGHWAMGLSHAANGELTEATHEWHRGVDVAASLSEQHLLVHLLQGLLVHWSAPAGELLQSLTATRDALQLAVDQHYLTGTSHLLGVVAILLVRSGDPATGAALLGAMEANGHKPRFPALPIVREALGDRFEVAASVGSAWSVKDAGSVALEALRSVVPVDPKFQA